MKVADSAELVLQNEVDAVINDRGLLTSPRPNVDREQLKHHLREVLRLLHVDLDDENLRDTPRRWSESLVTLTSGYDFTDVKKLTTLFRKACSAADENCQNLVVIGGTYKTLCAHHILPFFGQFIVGYIPERMIVGLRSDHSACCVNGCQTYCLSQPASRPPGLLLGGTA